MARGYTPNERAHATEQDFYRQQALKKHNEKVERNQERYKKDSAHYQGLLNDIVKYTMSQINSDTTPESMQQLFASGEEAWKIICARVRKTNSVLNLRNEAFKYVLIEELAKVYTPTPPTNDPTY